MLLYSGVLPKRIANNVFLERLLTKSINYEVVSRFQIRPENDELSNVVHVIFIEGYFNISRVQQDRIVLGVWSHDQNIAYICLVFDKKFEAVEFAEKVKPYIYKHIEVPYDIANSLLSADLRKALIIN